MCNIKGVMYEKRNNTKEASAMRKYLVVLGAMLLALPAFAQEKAALAKRLQRRQESPRRLRNLWCIPIRVPTDNHYIPSGWMGDYGDIKLNDQATDNPHSGTTCLQFVYSGKKNQGQGWAGVYWQNPANNWGSKKGGFDLTGMTKLTFWARGAKGGEVIQRVMVGGIQGTYPDTVKVEMGPIELTDTWKQYTITW